MKIKVQAQHLQSGDIVGSGELVATVIRNSTKLPSNKIMVSLARVGGFRTAIWGKYTEINIERSEKVEKLDAYSEAVLFATGHLPEDF